MDLARAKIKKRNLGTSGSAAGKCVTDFFLAGAINRQAKAVSCWVFVFFLKASKEGKPFTGVTFSLRSYSFGRAVFASFLP